MTRYCLMILTALALAASAAAVEAPLPRDPGDANGRGQVHLAVHRHLVHLDACRVRLPGRDPPALQNGGGADPALLQPPGQVEHLLLAAPPAGLFVHVQNARFVRG